MSEKERQNQQEETFKEIATTVADKCVNPDTKRPYPVTIIEKSMKQIHFSVKPNKNTKQQALEVISQLKAVIPIEKAQMKLRVICHKKHRKALKEMAAEVEEDKISGDGVLEMVQNIMSLTCVNSILSQVFLTDPGHYRTIDQLIKDTPKSQLHVLSLREVTEGEDLGEGQSTSAQAN